MKTTASLLITGLLAVHPAMASVTFTTFVTGSSLIAGMGQEDTIAFNYAGNKFVGSVYVNGANNRQLYSTDLTGGSVQPFGVPLPEGSGEVVVGASLGRGGYPTGDIYSSAENIGNIYHYSNAGGAPALFASLPSGAGGIKQIFFDPGSGFGGNMLVSTSSGGIYKVTSAGVVTQLANIGFLAEGMDIASSNYGQYAGQLLVASESSQQVYAIKADGTVKQLNLRDGSGNPTSIQLAETVSTVPLNLGASGNPLEGFYVANFATDIQKAGAGQFTGYLGDTIVTSELGSNSPLWDLHYNGDSLDTFTVTQIGTLPGQSEDGIFVTAERIADVTTPEPASLTLIGVGVAALAGIRRRRRRG